MLTPQQLLEIVDTMQPLLDELNQFITTDMISRLMARLGRGEDFLLTGTDQWQMEVYKAAGGHLEAVQQEIKRFTGKSDAEVQAIFEDAGIKAWDADDAFYIAKDMKSVSLLQSKSMLRILTDTYQRTNGEIHNLTRTTAAESQKKFIQVLDSTHFKVLTGAQSYTAAVQEAVEELAKTQADVIYPSGKRDSLETAVLRAVRTGTAQASGNMSLQGMIEHDWDLIRVSAHLGARYGDGGENPGNHFWWQGKLYSRTGQSTEYPDFVQSTGYGTGEGLSGWNCRHSFGPGDPNHNPFQDFDAEENKRAYDLSQKQRRAEARIRRQKKKLIGLHEAIKNTQDEGVKAALQTVYDKEAARLGRYNTEYNQFCTDNNLKRLSDRIAVAKWTRSEAVQAVKAGKQALENPAKSSIMNRKKSGNRENIRPISDKMFSDLTVEARKNGAAIVRGTEEAEKHLDLVGADASSIGDILFFRKEVTVSEVLEETYHYNQYLKNMFCEYSGNIYTALKEIDAKEYLLRNAAKYKIPREETEETKRQLAAYKAWLKKLKESEPD